MSKYRDWPNNGGSGSGILAILWYVAVIAGMAYMIISAK